MRHGLRVLVLAGVLCAGGAAFGQTTGPATGGGGVSEVLYEDRDAQSSATITQVLPNSTTSLMTLGAVRRIRIQGEVFVVEWGTTAVTMLPRQYVASVTVNKRAAASGQ